MIQSIKRENKAHIIVFSVLLNKANPHRLHCRWGLFVHKHLCFELLMYVKQGLFSSHIAGEMM